MPCNKTYCPTQLHIHFLLLDANYFLHLFLCVFLHKYFLSKINIFSLRQWSVVIHSLQKCRSYIPWTLRPQVWLGCSKIGAVPALINYNLRGQSLLHRWEWTLQKSCSCPVSPHWVEFFFQHSLGLCHCDHLWWRVDICSERYPERAWQGCEADVLGQVRIVEQHSQTRTLRPLPPQVPKWSESESGGGEHSKQNSKMRTFFVQAIHLDHELPNQPSTDVPDSVSKRLSFRDKVSCCWVVDIFFILSNLVVDMLCNLSMDN